jgi:hypothetical protein
MYFNITKNNFLNLFYFILLNFIKFQDTKYETFTLMNIYVLVPCKGIIEQMMKVLKCH